MYLFTQSQEAEQSLKQQTVFFLPLPRFSTFLESICKVTLGCSLFLGGRCWLLASVCFLCLCHCDRGVFRERCQKQHGLAPLQTCPRAPHEGNGLLNPASGPWKAWRVSVFASPRWEDWKCSVPLNTTATFVKSLSNLSKIVFILFVVLLFSSTTIFKL